MSYDWMDAAYDEAMDRLYEDFAKSAHEDENIYDRVVAQFKDSRLCAFYEGHPKISATANSMLAEANNLLSVSARCSLIFAACANEICLRDTLLRPIIHGCFHSDSAGNLIAALIADTKNRHITKALLDIFARYTGIDFREYKRSQTAKPLWEEILGVKSCYMIFADQGITACHPTFRHGRAQPWLRTRGS